MATTTAKLDARMKREIVDECRDLVIELVHAGDHGELEKAIDLWIPTGTWIRGGKPFTGREQLLESFKRASDTTLIRHLVVDTKITVKDESNAEGVSYYLAINHDPKTKEPKLPLPLEPFSMGEWHDKYVKTPQGWRFSHREVKRLFQKPGGGH